MRLGCVHSTTSYVEFIHVLVVNVNVPADAGSIHHMCGGGCVHMVVAGHISMIMALSLADPLHSDVRLSSLWGTAGDRNSIQCLRHGEVRTLYMCIRTQEVAHIIPPVLYHTSLFPPSVPLWPCYCTIYW